MIINPKKSKRARPSVYINVAPLVDVMLVLIIIFMITAPMMNVGVPVSLPQTQGASLADSKFAPIVVSIDKNSKIYIEEAEITLDDLLKKLPLILANGKSDTVYVRGDKALAYGKIMQVMGVLASSGVCKVSLLSEIEVATKMHSR